MVCSVQSDACEQCFDEPSRFIIRICNDKVLDLFSYSILGRFLLWELLLIFIFSAAIKLSRF